MKKDEEKKKKAGRAILNTMRRKGDGLGTRRQMKAGVPKAGLYARRTSENQRSPET